MCLTLVNDLSFDGLAAAAREKLHLWPCAIGNRALRGFGLKFGRLDLVSRAVHSYGVPLGREIELERSERSLGEFRYNCTMSLNTESELSFGGVRLDDAKLEFSLVSSSLSDLAPILFLGQVARRLLIDS